MFLAKNFTAKQETIEVFQKTKMFHKIIIKKA